jgi:hypothetical protein
MTDINLPYMIHGKAIDRVSADDRTWFKNNPGRWYRLRHLIEFEFNNEPLGEPGDGFTWYVLVASPMDGVRIRLPVSLQVGISFEGISEDEMGQDILAQTFRNVAPKHALRLMADREAKLRSA